MPTPSTLTPDMPQLRSGTDTGAPAAAQEDCSASLRLPTFWSQDPELWFAQVERQFDARRIASQSAKFGHAVSALPVEIAADIRDLILHPPGDSPYDTLKRELLDRTSLSIHRRLQQLLSAEELGDQKPSQLLRRMRQLTGSTTLDPAIMQELFLQRLPSDIRVVLTAAGEMPLDGLARLADRILDLQSAPAATPAYSVSAARPMHSPVHLRRSVSPPVPVPYAQPAAADLTATVNNLQCSVNQLTELVSGLTTLVADATAMPHRSPSPFRYRRDSRRRFRSPRRYRPPSPAQGSPSPFCWYHATFGAHARQCRQPCSWAGNVSPST